MASRSRFRLSRLRWTSVIGIGFADGAAGDGGDHATRDRARDARMGRLAAVPTPSATPSSWPSTESSDLPPLRYLDRAAVEASMPPVEERLRLAELTMRALASGTAQLPAKIGISPRPADSFAHAMPAHLRASSTGTDATDDLVGIKWVLGFPTNNAIGVPAIHAIAILNDPTT